MRIIFHNGMKVLNEAKIEPMWRTFLLNGSINLIKLLEGIIPTNVWCLEKIVLQNNITYQDDH